LSNWAFTVLGDFVPPNTPAPSGPWRPPQWNDLSQLVAITVNTPSLRTTSSSTAQDPATGNVVKTVNETDQKSTSTTYYFDAVMRLEHAQELTATKHPIQTGASLTDHAYLQPARVILEVAMSDVMDRVAPNLFTSNSSKSVSAFQTMLDVQAGRQPITLVTRLKTYNNMLILDHRAVEDHTTVRGARMMLRLEQIFVAALAQNTVSARPNQTNTTDEGTKVGQPPPPSLPLP
jgi:hypothetical protein